MARDEVAWSPKGSELARPGSPWSFCVAETVDECKVAATAQRWRRLVTSREEACGGARSGRDMID
jgi:hypothetical protein